MQSLWKLSQKTRHGNVDERLIPGVDVDSWRSVKEHFMIRYGGKVETTTFCHQIPKLVQDKTKTISNFAERCITEMREDATGCFLMRVTQAIKTLLVPKHPATLSEAIQEAMSLELIQKKNGTKSKIASLADMDDEELVEIKDLDDVTIKAINTKRAKSGRQPFWRPSQFTGSKGKGGKGISS
jgi:hypothetical protein